MNREGIYWDTQLLFHEMLITAFDEPTEPIIISKRGPGTVTWAASSLNP